MIVGKKLCKQNFTAIKSINRVKIVLKNSIDVMRKVLTTKKVILVYGCNHYSRIAFLHH